MPDNMNSRIDFLTVLSMRAEELRRLIFIEQLNNPMLEMTDYSFASFIHDRDPDEVRNELLAKGIEDPLLEAIVRIFFREILEGRISTISRSLQVTTNRVREAAAKIMDMIPYEPSEGGEIPDLEAEPEGDEWSIRVFPDEGILRLNEHYIQMVEELGEANTIEGFSNRIQRAKQLFASVQQRTDVLKEMMRRLLGAQRLFALHGGEPKEIPRRSLSDVLGVYPTVLYLASAGKYVRVPAGVIPMDRFFGQESELEAEREREAGEANNAVSVLSETGLLRASARRRTTFSVTRTRWRASPRSACLPPPRRWQCVPRRSAGSTGKRWTSSLPS